MVQAYNIEHPRSQDLDEEVQRPQKVDLDLGWRWVGIRVAPFRSQDKLVQRDLFACFGDWTTYKHMEVPLILPSFSIAAHINTIDIKECVGSQFSNPKFVGKEQM